MKSQYDLVIIGAGPSGLSAAINAASEGLSVLLCESNEFGGQARGSSLIENYAGFPYGISGPELTTLFIKQALKFGVEKVCPFKVISITKNSGIFTILSESGLTVKSKAILIATGLQYKSLPISGLDKFIGFGATYGSPSMSEDFKNKRVAIIGGANSAGQAATYLHGCNCEVSLIVRDKSIRSKMSSYLSDRIIECSKINIFNNAEVSGLYSDNFNLESISIIQERSDSPTYLKVDRLFILTGAKPETNWLSKYVTTINGLILTGHIDDLSSMEACPGIFVAGDVRYGSIKRVASAVGEGARVVNEIHQYLSQSKRRKHETITESI